MKKNLLILAAAATLAVSCVVDKDYGGLFDDKLDTEMTLLKGLTVPVGSFNKITIGEMASLEKSDFIQEVNGDYWICVDGNSYSYKHSIPSLNLSFPAVKTSASLGKITIPSIPAFDKVPLPFEINNTTRIDHSDFPKEVTALKSVTADARLSVTLTVFEGTPVKTLHLDEGLAIQLPDWAFFDTEKAPEAQGKELKHTYVNAHKLTIDQSIEGIVAEGMTISCPIAAIRDIPAGQGIVKAGTFTIEGGLPIKGAFSFSSKDLEAGAAGKTFNAGINCEVTIDIPEDAVAEVKLDIQPSFDSHNLNLDNIPEGLLDNSSALQFKDVYFCLDINNRFPAAFAINADITTFSKGTATHKYTLAGNPISAAANSRQKAVISQYGAKETGTKDYLIPEFSGILNPIPDRISLSGVKAKVTDEFIKISSADEYEMSIDYSIKAPLHLDASSLIEFDYTIDNIDLSAAENISFSEAEIAMKVENSSPLRIAIDADLYASDGKPASATISTIGAIEAGTVAAPVTSDIKISIKGNGPIDFKAINLHLKATSSASECLNKNQGIAFKDITLSIPSGITIK